VGGMSDAECERWRGAQAMHAIGRLAPDEERQFRAHLEECPACRAETAELGGVATALSLVDPGHLDDGVEPAIPLESARWERRRRVRMSATRWAMAGGAAAAVAAIALVVVAVQPAPAPSRTVALNGTPGVQASVVLTPKAWGTQATFKESGQKAGQVWTVTMESSPGSWWVAGSYRTPGSSGQVQVVLSCAVPADQITHVWVSNGAGHTVLRGYVQDS